MRNQLGQYPGLVNPAGGVIAEAGDHQRLTEIGLGGAVQSPTRPPGTPADGRGPLLAGVDVAHHTRHHLAVQLRGDGHRAVRQAVQVVDGAVDRVDDPPHPGTRALATGRGTVLLAQHGVVRPQPAQLGGDLPLHGPVSRGHHVRDGALGRRDRDSFGTHPVRGGRRAPGHLDRDLQQLRWRWRRALHIRSLPARPGIRLPRGYHPYKVQKRTESAVPTADQPCGAG